MTSDALVEIQKLNKKYTLEQRIFANPSKRIIHAVNDIDLQIIQG